MNRFMSEQKRSSCLALEAESLLRAVLPHGSKMQDSGADKSAKLDLRAWACVVFVGALHTGATAGSRRASREVTASRHDRPRQPFCPASPCNMSEMLSACLQAWQHSRGTLDCSLRQADWRTRDFSKGLSHKATQLLRPLPGLHSRSLESTQVVARARKPQRMAVMLKLCCLPFSTQPGNRICEEANYLAGYGVIRHELNLFCK